MRRFAVLLAVTVSLSLAQEHAPAAEHPTEHAAAAGHATEGEGHEGADHGDPMILWKWANFALLAIGLGILAQKTLPPYFAARNAAIRQGLADAAARKRDSEARVAAIEKRLANLDTEIASIRTAAAHEIENEEARLRQEGETAIAKLREHTEHEIASATSQAREELRAFAASLAIQSAEDRLRARLNPQIDAGLINGFLKGLNN